VHGSDLSWNVDSPNAGGIIQVFPVGLLGPVNSFLCAFADLLQPIIFQYVFKRNMIARIPQCLIILAEAWRGVKALNNRVEPAGLLEIVKASWGTSLDSLCRIAGLCFSLALSAGR
jgi:hypothetical protein